MNCARVKGYGPFRNNWIWLWIRLRLAWPCGCFDIKILRVLCVYAPGVSDERTEPEAESKAEAVVSKRPIIG